MKSKIIIKSLFVVITAVLLLIPSSSKAEGVGRLSFTTQIDLSQTDTLSIAQEVQNKINRNMFYTVFDWVTVKDSSNTLLLKGWVHVPWDKEIFEKEALKYSGHLPVKNEIKNAVGDDNLRWHAARTLYTDSEFENYIFFQNPPIHIIVVDGRILLYGNVLSVSQKEWADDLLTFGTNAVQIINHIKVSSQEVS